MYNYIYNIILLIFSLLKLLFSPKPNLKSLEKIVDRSVFCRHDNPDEDVG